MKGNPQYRIRMSAREQEDQRAWEGLLRVWIGSHRMTTAQCLAWVRENVRPWEHERVSHTPLQGEPHPNPSDSNDNRRGEPHPQARVSHTPACGEPHPPIVSRETRGGEPHPKPAGLNGKLMGEPHPAEGVSHTPLQGEPHPRSGGGVSHTLTPEFSMGEPHPSHIEDRAGTRPLACLSVCLSSFSEKDLSSKESDDRQTDPRLRRGDCRECPTLEIVGLWRQLEEAWAVDEEDRARAHGRRPVLLQPITDPPPPELVALIESQWARVSSLAQWRERFGRALHSEFFRLREWTTLAGWLVERPESKHGSIFAGLGLNLYRSRSAPLAPPPALARYESRRLLAVEVAVCKSILSTARRSGRDSWIEAQTRFHSDAIAALERRGPGEDTSKEREALEREFDRVSAVSLVGLAAWQVEAERARRAAIQAHLAQLGGGS